MKTMYLRSSIPKAIDRFELKNKEYMQYLYLPVCFPGDGYIYLEPRLEFLRPMLLKAAFNCQRRTSEEKPLCSAYVYLTVKQTFVAKSVHHNRPGWHADGFGTDDIQYCWFDKWPTEFLLGDYEVSLDDQMSMEEMQGYEDHYYLHGCTPPLYHPEPFSLFRIDQNHIHRTIPAPEDGVRTFVKITISDHKYAQEGNSHNYEYEYDWSLTARKLERNQPHVSEKH